jgi:hypothetical protein
MAGERSLALNKLVKDKEMLSEVEVASVVAPLLERLSLLHSEGRSHGNVSLATVTIRVVEPTDGTIHLPDPGSCDPAMRPCASCQQVEEGATPAADIWSVGVIALQLLCGMPCRNGCTSAIVDKQKGELPMMPRGTSLECIEFLMDCLEPRPEDRASAAELLAHDFLRTLTVPAGPKAPDAAETLAESLADVLLISTTGKEQRPACRPAAVPALKTKGRVSFSEPSHTTRCHNCRCQKTCGLAQPAVSRVRLDVSGVMLEKSAKVFAAQVSPNSKDSAASTKRKLGDLSREAPVASERKKQCSGLVKYLSPAILPHTAQLVELPGLVLAD